MLLEPIIINYYYDENCSFQQFTVMLCKLRDVSPEYDLQLKIEIAYLSRSLVNVLN